MPLRITSAHLMRAAGAARQMQGRMERVSKKAETAIESGVRAVVVGGTAFGLGVVAGRYGGVKVVGVPLELGVAVLSHLAGFSGIGGQNARHLHAVGDGALASYLTTTGRGVGIKMAAKSEGSKAVADRIAGELNSADLGAARLSDEELAKLAKRA